METTLNIAIQKSGRLDGQSLAPPEDRLGEVIDHLPESGTGHSRSSH